MPRFYLHTFCLMLILLMPQTLLAARGKVSGSAELSYARQSVKKGGVETVAADHFVQQYSLLWENKGKLNKGRLGSYDVALGYEWSHVDSEVNGQQIQIDNPLDKILYRGEIRIEPGGLPFNLRAYSHDMHRTNFVSNDLGTLFTDNRYDRKRGIVTDINNGTHVVSGLTFMAGITNGQYNGQYRDILSTLPKLLIDYKQEDVHDVRGLSPESYTNRDLAFISLNKKDNWFHYRRFEHIDNLHSSQNSSQDTYLLGTVDHNDRRQWVNLTNWIKVSTDLSYTEINADQSRGAADSSERYNINLFAKAARTRWQGNEFTTYSRTRNADRLESRLRVPVYANGELNRDTSWRFQMESYQYRDANQLNVLARDTDDLYTRGEVTAFRQARYIFKPRFEFENKSGSEGEGQAMRLNAEFSNNPLYRSVEDLFARYSISGMSGTGDTGFNASYVEQTLQAKLQKQLNSQLLVGGEQKFDYGTGAYDPSVSDRINFTLSGIGSFGSGTGRFDSDAFRSSSKAFVEIKSQSPMRNWFEVTFDVYDGDAVSGNQTSLTHRLNYNRAALRLSWSNNYIIGDGLPDGSTVGSNGISSIDPSAARSTDFSSSYSTRFFVGYSPSRASNFTSTIDYERFQYRTGPDVESMNFEENYEYTVWHVNGRVRKLLVVGETGEYDKKLTSGVMNSIYAFTLFSDYYPTIHTLLGARVRYEFDDLTDADTMLTYLTAGLNYAKFQVSLDYSYGRRPSTDTEPEILESKWEVKVKKTF